MEDQVAFFNNANQIIYDYSILIKNNQNILNNLLKDTTFDKFNDTKSIVNSKSNVNYYIDYENNLNVELNNNSEYIIIIDTITYNKFNVTRFNHY